MNGYDLLAKALGPEPTDVYDMGMQPESLKSARRWVKDKRRGPHIYPVHGHATLAGTPLTFFRCVRCGTITPGTPYADGKPDRCFIFRAQCDGAELVPADQDSADRRVLELEGPEFLARFKT